MRPDLSPEPLVEVDRLQVHLPVTRPSGRGALLRAVDDVSLTVRAGETLGLVGESGGGKSTLGRALVGLRPPSGGSVRYRGRDLAGAGRRGLRELRRQVQIVFQDPYSSLNPRMRVGDIVAEPLIVHKLVARAERPHRVAELLGLVGLDPVLADRYPDEFSGGQRQRIGIARALAVDPEFIVLDEPISALDVSIQAQILNLLVDLRERLHLTYLFIAHDLSAVRHLSTRVGVMYLGRIVEIGTAEKIYGGPRHPYTQALLSALPVPDPHLERRRERIVLRGDLPSPIHPPPGCHFHPRCWLYESLGRPSRCREEPVELGSVADDHDSACHFPAEAAEQAAERLRLERTG
ncbi:oligopeptide/dipeptide ABC transporter ATP-binding protein [Micromonospora sp. WMMD1082]|uniref:ABC transporter ATP-binding protein n=1 Tax=Micromonospora sp. WMMD1082 TaxID=3016104 RepID=UPI0024176321|nr:oligopeptide/dipeptide ABC transporter ATP-binding protein [Micromonospora sp. WMMD1082]MDG4798371.1 ATP-binding cassette domain-containing protein [Micromonospora sp. WMMD1082]